MYRTIQLFHTGILNTANNSLRFVFSFRSTPGKKLQIPKARTSVAITSAKKKKTKHFAVAQTRDKRGQSRP